VDPEEVSEAEVDKEELEEDPEVENIKDTGSALSKAFIHYTRHSHRL
jgi:hypothetical protein